LPEVGQVKESQLEQAIIDELQKFLLELGKGFSFVARQMRISTETSHFFIDLVFYNYLLKCFVIIDLKTGKLSHQDIGQMDMYVRMFDDLKLWNIADQLRGAMNAEDFRDYMLFFLFLRHARRSIPPRGMPIG